jgi:hypothetical protein
VGRYSGQKSYMTDEDEFLDLIGTNPQPPEPEPIPVTAPGECPCEADSRGNVINVNEFCRFHFRSIFENCYPCSKGACSVCMKEFVNGIDQMCRCLCAVLTKEHP